MERDREFYTDGYLIQASSRINSLKNKAQRYVWLDRRVLSVSNPDSNGAVVY